VLLAVAGKPAPDDRPQKSMGYIEDMAAAYRAADFTILASSYEPFGGGPESQGGTRLVFEENRRCLRPSSLRTFSFSVWDPARSGSRFRALTLAASGKHRIEQLLQGLEIRPNPVAHARRSWTRSELGQSPPRAPICWVKSRRDQKLSQGYIQRPSMAESKPSISVCTISGAEAGRIGRALASVQDWTLERIIVLNEEVRDGTEEIALKCGARVYREPWKGYIAQKNSAADKATGEWLLDLDADEAVSPELRTKLRQFPTCHLPGIPPSVFRGFPGIAGAGFGTATGIRTGRSDCGAGAKRGG
jgi:hypothetical protein